MSVATITTPPSVSKFNEQLTAGVLKTPVIKVVKAHPDDKVGVALEELFAGGVPRNEIVTVCITKAQRDLLKNEAKRRKVTLAALSSSIIIAFLNSSV